MLRAANGHRIAIAARDARPERRSGGAGVSNTDDERLLSDAETRVIYRQAEDQIPLATELIGLTATEAALLPTLPRGQALWRVGQRSFLVQHVLSSVEEQLVNTDAAMLVGATA